ncbi:Tmem107 [Symbiodinium sp. KB8]|nr:Tmem107 [Symbiodinium sp. KB8]
MVRTDVVVPCRFLLTTGHFILLLLAYFHRDASIAAGLPSSPAGDTKASAESSFAAAFALSVICFALHFNGIFGGFTLFFRSVNLIQLVCQFMGGLLTALFILDSWHYIAIWYIFAFCTLLPALFEVGVLVAVFGLGVLKY